MMKQIFGILLILLGLFLSLSIFIILIQLLLNTDPKIPNHDSAHSFGYFLGLIIGMGIFIVLNLAIFFFGFKLLKNKKKELQPIPDEEFPSQLKH